jgi:hypothetical protein
MTLMAADHSSNADDRARRFSVKARLTPKRPRRQIENDEYGAFARRVPRAYRRVGDGDVEALVLLAGEQKARRRRGSCSSTCGSTFARFSRPGLGVASSGQRTSAERRDGPAGRAGTVQQMEGIGDPHGYPASSQGL